MLLVLELCDEVLAQRRIGVDVADEELVDAHHVGDELRRRLRHSSRSGVLLKASKRALTNRKVRRTLGDVDR